MRYPKYILLAGLAACGFLLGAVPDAAAKDKNKGKHGGNHYDRDDHYDHHDHDDDHGNYRGRYYRGYRYGNYGYGYGGYPYRYAPAIGVSIVSRPVIRTVAPAYSYGGGNMVASVQAELNSRGYGAGRVDGVMGGQTRRAIAAFQSRNGLYASGAIDEPLLRALRLI